MTNQSEDQPQKPNRASKQWLAVLAIMAAWMLFFFGEKGIDNFGQGRMEDGVVMLLVTLFVGLLPLFFYRSFHPKPVPQKKRR